MRHRLAKLICQFALSFTAFGQTRAADRSLGKPNIVILLADDLGYRELGCQGNTEIPTRTSTRLLAMACDSLTATSRHHFVVPQGRA